MKHKNIEKRNTKYMIAWLLAIAWMVVIFSMSAQNADTSSETSCRVGKMVGQLVIPHFRELPVEKQMQFAEKIDHPVRKCAHATEYAILCVLWINVFMKTTRKMRGKYCLAYIITVCYAISDEFHQRFVPGRSCQATDVLIDASGAFVGLMIYIVIISVHKRHERIN